MIIFTLHFGSHKLKTNFVNAWHFFLVNIYIFGNKASLLMETNCWESTNILKGEFIYVYSSWLINHLIASDENILISHLLTNYKSLSTRAAFPLSVENKPGFAYRRCIYDGAFKGCSASVGRVTQRIRSVSVCSAVFTIKYFLSTNISPKCVQHKQSN